MRHAKVQQESVRWFRMAGEFVRRFRDIGHSFGYNALIWQGQIS